MTPQKKALGLQRHSLLNKNNLDPRVRRGILPKKLLLFRGKPRGTKHLLAIALRLKLNLLE
ncbi:MAG: hypothetical protein CR994_05275 [Maribacter sp.]|nr:MAG: hypothetical protein CR994_05275 [Maribacter sp.]